jgi:hypothetical protein
MNTILKRHFGTHPRAVSESDLTHAGAALQLAVRRMGTGLSALLHAVISRLLEMTASSMIRPQHGDTAVRRIALGMPRRPTT